jgi:hypothetical protein
MATVRLSSAEYIGESSRSASGHPSRKAAFQRGERRRWEAKGFFLIGMPDTMATRTAARQGAKEFSTGLAQKALQRLSAGRPGRRSGPYLGPRRERLERDVIQSGERLRDDGGRRGRSSRR